MGKPAARLGDMAGHAGTITFGEPTVLIGGMPAARVGDPLVCPGFDGPKPHVAGNIIMGSTSVIIGGSFAARMGDPTGCGTVGVVGKGMPPVKGPPGPDVTYTGVVTGQIGDESGNLIGVKGNEDGKNSAGVLWGQAKGYNNGLGARGEVEGSLIHAGGETDSPIGKVGGSIDFGNAAANASIGLGGASAGGEASVLKGKALWETSEENPVFIGVEGEGKILTAEAKADVVLGTDGRRTGLFLGAGAEAAAAKGDISGKTGFKIPIPFTDYSFTLGAKAKIGGSAGSVGAGGHVGVYHDREDNKVHASIGGKLAAIVGLKFDLDIMFGLVPDKPKPPPNGVGVPMTPGSIIAGCPTVLIG